MEMKRMTGLERRGKEKEKQRCKGQMRNEK
jgi:hypothetical protein